MEDKIFLKIVSSKKQAFLYTLMHAPPHPNPELSGSSSLPVNSMWLSMFLFWRERHPPWLLPKLKAVPNTDSGSWKSALFPFAANCQVINSRWKLILQSYERHRCTSAAGPSIWQKRCPYSRLTTDRSWHPETLLVNVNSAG